MDFKIRGAFYGAVRAYLASGRLWVTQETSHNRVDMIALDNVHQVDELIAALQELRVQLQEEVDNRE